MLDPVGMLDKNNEKKYVKLLTIQSIKIYNDNISKHFYI